MTLDFFTLYSPLGAEPADYPNHTMPASAAATGQRGDMGHVGLHLQDRS